MFGLFEKHHSSNRTDVKLTYGKQRNYYAYGKEVIL